MKRKLMIGIIIVLVLLMGGLITFVVLNKDNESNNNVIEKEDNNTSNVVELDDEEQKAFDSLLIYGKEIYEKEGYTDFEKDDRGVYYATINDLIEKNYDTSMIDENCGKDEPIIFFDIDHKLLDNYDAEPLQVVVRCEGVENNS